MTDHLPFDEAIKRKFEEDPALRLAHPEVYAIVSGPDSPRRRRQVRRMLREVRKQGGYADGATIDWSKIDWLKVLQWIGAILGILLLL